MLERAALRLSDHITLGALAVRELTALLPLRPLQPTERHELYDLLAEVDRSQAYAEVAGLHCARWMVVNHTDQQTTLGSRSGESGPLVFCLVFDGAIDEVLDHLFDLPGRHLDKILRHCEGFPEHTTVEERIAFLKQARVKSGYLFSDVARSSQCEVKDAAALWNKFTQFYVEHQGIGDVKLLRAAFTRAFLTPPARTSVPTTWPFERRMDSEERWIRRVVELTRRLQAFEARKDKRRDPNARALRVAHTKHHGCLWAEFRVHADIDPRYRLGVFAQARSFEAVLRLSNTSNRVRADGTRDGRGLSIKLLGVQGERAAARSLPDGWPELGDGSTQDFLLLSHAAFFARNVRDFTLLRSTLDHWTGPQRALRLLAFFAARPRELSNLLKTRRKIDHPFEIDYHSMTPYLLGDRLAVKYSVRRKHSQQPFRFSKPDRHDPDFLRRSLQESLHPESGAPIALEFCIHVSEYNRLPIEDASIDWNRLGAAPIPVATIMIAPQNFSSDAALKRCQQLVFTPWHALKEHKPLGSLNRARLPIYQASSEGREDISTQREAPSGSFHSPALPTRLLSNDRIRLPDDLPKPLASGDAAEPAASHAQQGQGNGTLLDI